MTTIDIGIYQGIEELNVLGKHVSILHFLSIMDTEPLTAYMYSRGFGDSFRREGMSIRQLKTENIETYYKKVTHLKEENKKSGKWTNTFLLNPAKYINQLPTKKHSDED